MTPISCSLVSRCIGTSAVQPAAFHALAPVESITPAPKMWIDSAREVPRNSAAFRLFSLVRRRLWIRVSFFPRLRAFSVWSLFSRG